MRVLSFLFATLFAVLCQLHVVSSNPVTLETRQTANFVGQIGLLNPFAAVSDILSNPTNALNDLKNITDSLEQQVTVIAQIKPNATSPSQDDIVDITIQVIIEFVNGVLTIPIIADIQLPFLDSALGKWLQAWNTPYPGTSQQVGYGLENSPDYIHLLQLNLTVSLDVLGLGNVLEGLGL